MRWADQRNSLQVLGRWFQPQTGSQQVNTPSWKICDKTTDYEREIQADRQRKTDRQRQTHTHTEGETWAETERQRQTDKHRYRHRQRDRHRERHRERQRDRDGERQRQTETERHRERRGGGEQALSLCIIHHTIRSVAFLSSNGVAFFYNTTAPK